MAADRRWRRRELLLVIVLVLFVMVASVANGWAIARWKAEFRPIATHNYQVP